jgi:quinol monooxygenase YgiN
MNIVRSDIYLKDEMSVARFREMFAGRRPKMEASGATILMALVNEEDPLHLMYLEQWETREHFDAYLKWARAQPDTADLGALFSRAPEHIWMRTLGS